jgi:hypothetical protein
VTGPRNSRDPVDVPEPVVEPGPPYEIRRKAKVDPTLRRDVAAVVRGVHADALAASLAAKPQRMRFAVQDLPAGSLTAAGLQGYPVIRVTGPIWTAPSVTAAAGGPPARSKARRRRPRSRRPVRGRNAR